MNREQEIRLVYRTKEDGQKVISVPDETVLLDQARLLVTVEDPEAGTGRTFPVFRQNAMTYGDCSEYVKRHGCACCSLTTVLAAYVSGREKLTPEETIQSVEPFYIPEQVYSRNYAKPMARQMPLTLYAISGILSREGVKNRYIGPFEDEDAGRQILSHLYTGRPVIIETSRMRRWKGHIVRLNDKKYAGSYHTMVLLGVCEDGRILFTDSATRSWAGEKQRLKIEELSVLISYMFPQKKEGDSHLYFHRRRETGGYILVDRWKGPAEG